jgi:hypothetical protein
MDLVTISYRPGCLVTRFDHRGKPIGSYALQEPIVMTALPRVTAMRYAHLPEFKIEPYVLESQKRYEGKGVVKGFRDDIGTKGTRRRTHDATPSAAPATQSRSRVQTAAETGDLSAAINNQ